MIFRVTNRLKITVSEQILDDSRNGRGLLNPATSKLIWRDGALAGKKLTQFAQEPSAA